MPFDPPRAGITASTFNSWSVDAEGVPVTLIHEPLLNAQRCFGEHRGDASAGTAIAIQMVGRVTAVGDLRTHRRDNLGAVVADIHDVAAAIAATLPRADVHRRHADIRALANRRARIADDARTGEHETHPRLDWKVL